MPVVLQAPVPEQAANDLTPLRRGGDEGGIDIGASLRTAREAAGRSLPACAAALRLRPEHLRAIEENAFAELPGGGVTVGWLRRYARLLRLDPTPLITAYRQQHWQEARAFRSDLTTRVPTRRSRRRRSRVALVAVGVSLAGVIVLAAVAVRWLPAGGLAALLPLDPALNTPSGQTEPALLPVLTVPATPAPALPEEGAATPAPTAPVAPIVPAAPAPHSHEGGNTPAGAQSTGGAGLLRLKALAPVTLELRTSDGTLVTRRRLAAGDIYTIPAASQPLRMQADDPAALQVLGDAPSSDAPVTGL